MHVNARRRHEETELDCLARRQLRRRRAQQAFDGTIESQLAAVCSSKLLDDQLAH